MEHGGEGLLGRAKRKLQCKVVTEMALVIPDSLRFRLVLEQAKGCDYV